MLRLPKRTLPLLHIALRQTRSLHAGAVLRNKSKQEQETDAAWEHANIDRSTISNQAVPQPASEAIPSSMMAAFHNMFDRGANVGIEVITKNGFVLSNHIKIDQAMLLVNGTAFLWNPPPRTPGFIAMKDWDLETFKIFEVVSPRPELVMFGTGKEFSPIPDHIRKYFFKLGIQVDQMNSKHAAATYNVLAEEGRRVAAALLPLEEKED